MSTRVYYVTNTHSGKARLIRAASQSQAIRFASKSELQIRVASQDDIIHGLTEGWKIIEDSSAIPLDPEEKGEIQ